MHYTWKVKLLKRRWLNILWRYWRAFRGEDVGNYGRLPEHIRQYAPGRSFVDIGCMWGVNGEYAFLAEEAGATNVKGVDVFGPTPEFERKKLERSSSVEFVLGDLTSPSTLERIGVVDVVLCAGVLYHHPAPFDVLVALRRICGATLILRTSTIPEIGSLPNAAVYFPFLSLKDRKLWDLASLGVPNQVGIRDGFEPDQGYGNWFWGLTPTCLESMLRSAGFRIERRFSEPFAETVVCSPVEAPFRHDLPGEENARQQGEVVSASGRALPC